MNGARQGETRMPADLLLELEKAAPIAVDLEGLEKQGSALEQLWDVYMDQMSAAVERLKGSALAFENMWRLIILYVAEGRTADMQEARGQALASFERRLDLL